MSIQQHCLIFQLGLTVLGSRSVSFTLINTFPRVGSMWLNILKLYETATHIYSMSDSALLDEMYCVNKK